MKNKPKKWKLLIVDDDRKGLHLLTITILEDLIYKGQEIDFISVYSAKEAKQALIEQNDIAVILLDVVMETNNSGLKLISNIRDSDNLDNKKVQIIIRTGQPGASQKDIINLYDINDYIEKQTMTDIRLYTSVRSALKTYDSLVLKQEEIDEKTRELEQIFNLSVPLIEVGADFKIKRTNESLKKYFGLPSEKKVQGYCYDVLKCNKRGKHDTKTEKGCSMLALKKGAKTHDYNNHRESLGLYYQVKSIAIRDERIDSNDDNIISVIENVVDTTELENQKKEKERFISQVSHDVRDPLRDIESGKDALINICNNNKHLKSIIAAHSTLKDSFDRLSYFSLKPENYYQKKEPTNIFNLLNGIEDSPQSRIENKDLSFKVQIENKEVFPKVLFIDRVAFKVILNNLIGNAIKFSHKGVIICSLDYRINQDNIDLIDLIIKVKDEGIGIPPDKLEYIFEDHAKLNVIDVKGDGIGLPTVRKIVEEVMGGTIKADSKGINGKGSTFIVSLPRIKKSNKKIVEKYFFDTNNISFKEATLLIVDDKPKYFELVESIFKNTNIKVLGATSESEAKIINNDINPDFILMDIELGNNKKGGINLAKIFKKGNSVPIYAFTNLPCIESLGKDSKFFDGFITKSNDDLTASVYKAMMNHLKYDKPYIISIKEKFSTIPENVKSNDFKEDINILLKEWEKLKLDESYNNTKMLIFKTKLDELERKYDFKQLKEFNDNIINSLEGKKVIKKFKNIVEIINIKINEK